MKDKEKSTKFSIKKLLLTMLCTTIITTFIGFTILFINVVPLWINSEIGETVKPVDGINDVGDNSEGLIQIGQSMEETLKNFEEQVAEEKEAFGEDYPSAGIQMYLIVNYLSSNSIVHTYLIALLAGIISGGIIYIVSIQGTKGKKLILEIIAFFVILVLIISLINFVYRIIFNKVVNSINETYIYSHTYVFDIENNNILLPYLVIFIIVYLVNMIRQKIITNKLNKELNKEENKKLDNKQ